MAGAVLGDLGGSMESPWGPVHPLGVQAEQVVIPGAYLRTAGEGPPGS